MPHRVRRRSGYGYGDGEGGGDAGGGVRGRCSNLSHSSITSDSAPDGKIREQTVFFRPLPAAATALRLLAAGLGRRRSLIRAGLISGLTRPRGLLTRVGDGIGVRFVRPTF